ncbi:GNAT family N-acetyltransferase [Paenibacillus glycanilyticus]|uniref:GNAT family N-acetyltransferase n=1 Tax=Paenibacillus glycanilyticus TaxID=126569 RepID=A0ABQ6NK54_9BACL|nr:GNAT family N-acetyltransferase [Paenibacillus glycanilyticus]GMK45159.1 GNAT family N-acetyltransferase [Paenibacillus glycanilyticus]
MSESFRQAGVEDAERLREVTYEAYSLIRELKLNWPAANAGLDQIRDNITQNECYVLEADGVIVATITLSRNDEVKAITDLPFIKWFAVHPGEQGKGYGDKLLTWVENTIIRDKEGAAAVTLGTAEKHPWLLPMYQRRGYESIRSFDSGNGDGTMHLLRKIVNPELFEKASKEQTTAN